MTLNPENVTTEELLDFIHKCRLEGIKRFKLGSLEFDVMPIVKPAPAAAEESATGFPNPLDLPREAILDELNEWGPA